MDTKRALEGIAIVGMGGRLPGAPNLDVFWDNLANGVESSTVFSGEEIARTLRRLNVDTALLNRPNYVKTGYIIDGVEWFDPGFFGISSKEAELIDPQHRLFLECAWETLENAGYAPGPSCPRTGVFGGCSMSQYLMANLYHHVDFSKAAHPLQNLVANDKDYLTTRISYTLDLKGPSVAVQSACSTSLVAICMACDSLRDYQCDLALAGGVTVMVPQTIGYLYEEGNVYSPDGHCRPFDARAAGTVFGSGVGMVALKRLEDAQAAGDNILAVIKDTAINNDGIAKVGYTAPNELAQAEVIAMAHARAEVDAGTITYVETHGTGTQLGDPIEIAALTRAFRKNTERKGFCAIGSVKSNVGHLQAAAGIASLIKTVLAMQRKMLPPSLHFEQPNAAIDFANSPFYVNARLSPWEVNGAPRRAGVSSFGMGGTNAHVVLEEAPVPVAVERRSGNRCLLPLSAKSDRALRELAGRYETFLAENPDRVADICFTAAVGRAHFNHRLAVVGDDSRLLREQLAAFRRGESGVASESDELLPRLARQYERGESVDWTVLGAGRRLPLPTYPFERQRCWVEPASGRSTRGGEAVHPLLGSPIPAPESDTVRFESNALPAFLEDHVIAGKAVYPAAAYWEMAFAAGKRLFGALPVLQDCTLYEPLFLNGASIQTTLEPAANGTFTFRVYSLDAVWKKHAQATLVRGECPADTIDVSRLLRSITEAAPVDALYRAWREQGSEHGPMFQSIAELWCGEGQALGRIRLPDALLAEASDYRFHPAMLDGCLQIAAIALGNTASAGQIWVPAGMGRLSASSQIGISLWVHARRAAGRHASVVLDAYDENGRRVAEFQDVRYAAVSSQSWRTERSGDCYQIVWRPKSPTENAGVRSPSNWLIFMDRGQTGSEVAGLLEAGGDSCVRVFPGDVDPADADGFMRFLADGAGAGFRGVIYLWGLDACTDVSLPTLERDGNDLCIGLLHLVRALAGANLQPPPRVWVATRETQAVALDAVRAPGAAPLWGLARVAAHEHPEFGCVCIDLGPEASGAQSLIAELRQGDEEDQIAYRRGIRYVARLARLPDGRRSRPSGPFRLSSRSVGSAEYLELVPASRRAPGPHEVEIEVRAAGINFKDILVTLGRVPAAPLGSDCAGVVCAVGNAVDRLQPGDGVLVAIAPGCMASHVTVPAACVVPIPEGWSFTEAATLPIVFATAYHSLVNLAKLRAGETVLIHAAAGGVGFAAVRLAQRMGAKVFATASPAKWQFLRAAGVEHAMNSRTLDFAAEISRLTGGRGVDVVLNSLAEPFAEKTFEVTAENGRFVELGKLETSDSERVYRQRADVSYFKFDLGEEFAANPAFLQETLGELRVADPLPHHVFPIEDAEAAFRFVAQGRHIGKVVLSIRTEETFEIRHNATYLITGGLGALGRQAALRLMERGASHVVLTGRGASEEAIQDLKRDGVQIAAVRSDVADPNGLAAVERLLESGWPPLRGVIHAAGVLDDGILLQQSAERFRAVMAPKVSGVWNLHELTRGRRLDFFICFSSISSILGVPGQGSYAAANAFLDAFAHYRRSLGLPALTIDWGPWAGSGMAARNAHPARLAALGMETIAGSEGIDLLERLSRRDHAQVAAFPVRWESFRKSTGKSMPLLEELALPGEPVQADPVFLKQLRAASQNERQELLRAYLRAQVARILGLPSPESIEPRQRLFDMGLDSLAALELRNLLEAGLGTPLRATLLFDCGSIAELEAYLMANAIAKEFAEPAAAAAETPPAIPGNRSTAAPEPIAIVGMGCRFPGSVQSPSAYWKLLCGGVDAITEIPSYRWNIDDYYDPDPAAPDKTYCRSGGFLGPVEDFDPHFFGMSPREAVSLDPQQRLLLETSWEALEHAQLPPDRLFGSDAGVFLGISIIDNATNLRNFADPRNTDAYYGTGNSMSGAAGRLSYIYGLKGPSMAVETACSSSLVAVHLACRSLLSGECSRALAAGVNVILSPAASVVFSRARMLSPDGRCKTFSDAADGYGRGEGCGVVILERLSDAIKNRSRIVAVIRGSAVNQDGASGGLTVPNGPSQQAVIRQALHSGGVDAAMVRYVEAHGTGTALGDPIEVNALGAVFGKHRSPADPLIIGTVKSNIGHLESAAGIAGVIKLALCLHNAQIPASLHFDRPNRNIPWDELPLRVATAIEPWPAKDKQRIGGVSSFGFAGTNAHVVMEQAPPLEDELFDREPPCRLLTLSAKTDAALKDLTLAYERFLALCPEEDFANACNGANTGRMHFKHRIGVVAASATEASRMLTELRSGRTIPGVCTGKAANVPPRIVFLFTGQGSQYFGMGRQLYETQPVFRAAMEQCAGILAPLLQKPLLEALYASDPEGLLNQTAYTQPALFAVEYALAKLWESWGIRPAALLGHSIGEYVAACLAGVFRLEDGLELVAVRGRLMQALPAGGGMAAVFAEEQRVRAAIAGAAGEVCVAAVNGPHHTVVSGRRESLEAALAPLAAEGVRLEKLNVSHAFHSHLMDPMLSEFRRAAARVRYGTPRLTLISNVTGEPHGPNTRWPEYWADHLRQPVNFNAGMEHLGQKGYRTFVEIGPQPVLLGMGRTSLPGDDCMLIPSLRQSRGESQQIFGALGTLYTAGAVVDWEGFERGKRRPRAILPSYPFQKVRHWYHEPGAPAKAAMSGKRPNPSRVVDLLDRGDAGELVLLLERSTGLSEVDKSVVERVVRGLVEEHQEHLPSSDLYQLEWRAAGPAKQGQASPPPGAWVIFADAGGVGQALAHGLRAQGHHCTLVYRDKGGPSDNGDDNGVRRVDPSAAGEFVDLFAQFTEPLREVVYLWNLDAAPTAVFGLLHLVQAMTAGLPARKRLWVVTRGAVNTGGKPSSVDVWQAPSWGLGRVIAVEHPEIWGGLIDLDPADSAAAMVALLAEVCGESGRGEQIAFRGGQRLVARLTRSSLTEAGMVQIRSDATYLIAGGLGAIGLGLAKWMASQGARHLVLTSRAGLTERTGEQVRELESMGVQVLALAADAASESDMARIFTEVAGSMPPMRGIVHAAGLLHDGLLFQQNRERFDYVMAPKVQGAWNLHRCSEGLELDFFVLFSSIAALLPAPGQGNYSAANAFLDALAAHRRAHGQPALSINWGPWSELGMVASRGQLVRERLESHGLRLLAPAQAFRMFGKLLAAPVAQMAVMSIDWSIVKRQLHTGTVPPVMEDFLDAEPADAPTGDRYIEELKAAPASDRGALLTAYLQRRIGDVLGMTPPQAPPVDQGFADLGIDSLMTMELKRMLEFDLGISFSPAVVFNYPTIESLSNHLGQALGIAEGVAPAPTETPKSVEQDLAVIEEIRNSSEEELAAFIAQEYTAHQ